MNAPLKQHWLDPTRHLPGALEIRGLGKQYAIEGKPLTVLENINLAVKPGEFVSIVGASGCGKSSLLRLIVGLEAEYSGDILLDGERIVSTSLERGIVFQDHRLFPWKTVEQNIALALKNHRLSNAEKARLVAEHIQLVNLQGFEKAYPHQLSGGMAQRAAIARALINKPKILLLDEPFAGVDPIAVEDIQQIVWKLKDRNIGILITDHNVQETLSITDRAYLLFEGKILFQGTPEELAENKIVREKYLSNSFVLRRKDFMK